LVICNCFAYSLTLESHISSSVFASHFRYAHFIYVNFDFYRSYMLSPFTYWCLSHNKLFSSEFDDYSIVCNKLFVSGDFICIFYLFLWEDEELLKKSGIRTITVHRLPSIVYRPSNIEKRTTKNDYRTSSNDYRPSFTVHRKTKIENRTSSNDYRPSKNEHRKTNIEQRSTKNEQRTCSAVSFIKRV
jgi:hypothetical protein